MMLKCEEIWNLHVATENGSEVSVKSPATAVTVILKILPGCKLENSALVLLVFVKLE